MTLVRLWRGGPACGRVCEIHGHEVQVGHVLMDIVGGKWWQSSTKASRLKSNSAAPYERMWAFPCTYCVSAAAQHASYVYTMHLI